MRTTVACFGVAPMFLAALVSCRTSTSTSAPPASSPAHVASTPPAPPADGGSPLARTAKEDCEALMNFVLPFAQKMLKERHEFVPFGATMSPSGEISGAMSLTGDEKADVNQLVSLLERGFRQGATEGKFKATALVVDMVIIPPGKSAKQDGVAVRLDHRDGYSVIVGFPYSFSGTGELLMEPPFATEGAHQIFPAR
jgi:hypothetical protein